MAQLHAIVYGQVQGVSFRAYAVDQARRLKLTGWVRNQTDGTVQTIAVGSRMQLDAFVTWLHQGSPAAQVTNVNYTIADTETERFDSFEVRH
jgi:acylphosphatase